MKLSNFLYHWMEASVNKLPGECLSRGCDSVSDVRGMTGLDTQVVGVGFSKAESFDCAKWVDSVREFSVTCEIDVVLWAGPS